MMARPAAEVINSRQVTNDFGIDILSTATLWAIIYQEQPFSIRYRYWGMNGEFPKYIRTVFPHKSSADNLAKRLNEYFFTEDFTVVKVL
jgi:hypothetical protein